MFLLFVMRHFGKYFLKSLGYKTGEKTAPDLLGVSLQILTINSFSLINLVLFVLQFRSRETLVNRLSVFVQKISLLGRGKRINK
ncbi:hypothetical protein FKM82_020183 [Ascaphus truei]